MKDYVVSDYLVRAVDQYAYTKFQILLDQLPLDESLRILNVGCGSGEANLWLVQKGHVIDAIDPSEKAIFMSLKIKEQYKLQRVNVIHVGIEDFSSDVLYDCVFATDVLEHIDSDRGIVQKFYSLLKTGGTVFISVPAMPSLFGHHDRMLSHYRRYTKQSLLAIFIPWFDVLYLRYFGFFFIPVTFLFSRLLKRSYPIQSSHDVGILRRGLGLLLNAEKRIAFPKGTSLLLVGRKR